MDGEDCTTTRRHRGPAARSPRRPATYAEYGKVAGPLADHSAAVCRHSGRQGLCMRLPAGQVWQEFVQTRGRRRGLACRAVDRPARECGDSHQKTLAKVSLRLQEGSRGKGRPQTDQTERNGPKVSVPCAQPKILRPSQAKGPSRAHRGDGRRPEPGLQGNVPLRRSPGACQEGSPPSSLCNIPVGGKVRPPHGCPRQKVQSVGGCPRLRAISRSNLCRNYPKS